VINTSTTIITFLMVFLIQSTQNRDTAALQVKLDDAHARYRRTRAIRDSRAAAIPRCAVAAHRGLLLESSRSAAVWPSHRR